MTLSKVLRARHVFAGLAAGFVAAAAPLAAQAAPDNGLGMAILSARVNGTTLVAGSGATGAVANPNVGSYHVQFDRDVSGCFYSATLEDASGQATALPSPGGATFVAVATQNSSGTPADAKFYLLVYCAR